MLQGFQVPVSGQDPGQFYTTGGHGGQAQTSPPGHPAQCPTPYSGVLPPDAAAALYNQDGSISRKRLRSDSGVALKRPELSCL